VIAFVMAATLGAAPMADVWPYRAKRLTDGATEYSYDLSALKLSGGSADAKAANGEEKVAAFLKGLPRDVKLKVRPGTPLTIGAGRGLEPNPLATSFALVNEGPIEIDNPIARKPGARLRPPFDPNEPKILVGAEMVLWQVRTLEEAALAAVEVDTEWLRRDLWGKVADRAVLRFRAGQGDIREGALALAARVIVANGCLDRSRLPPSIRSDGELSTAVDAELQKLLVDPDATAVPMPWASNSELACGWVRTRALGQTFENSRAGTVAVLLFLEVIESDSKLRAFWERIRVRRDRFVGAPTEERIVQWREATAGNARKSLESLNEFIESLPGTQRTPPPLMALPVTPFARFMTELAGPERVSMVEELASAVQDGRVAPPDTTWPTARDSELVPFASTDTSKAVQFDSGWRNRLVNAFATLQGLHHDGRSNDIEPLSDSSERAELVVRLQVPPMLEVEPLPLAFERAAVSLERLVSALTVDNLTGLKAFAVDGRRWPDTIISEAKRFQPMLRGLAKLASHDHTLLDGRDVAEARRFISSWRSEMALTRDVRVATGSPLSAGSERAHAAVLGVGRRELAVAFNTKPTIDLEGPRNAFELNTEAEQRYIVPVLVSVAANAPPSARPIERSVLKLLVDGSGRDRTRSEGAFVEALSAP